MRRSLAARCRFIRPGCAELPSSPDDPIGNHNTCAEREDGAVNSTCSHHIPVAVQSAFMSFSRNILESICCHNNLEHLPRPTFSSSPDPTAVKGSSGSRGSKLSAATSPHPKLLTWISVKSSKAWRFARPLPSTSSLASAAAIFLLLRVERIWRVRRAMPMKHA